jgi:hypothetical protein
VSSNQDSSREFEKDSLRYVGAHPGAIHFQDKTIDVTARKDSSSLLATYPFPPFLLTKYKRFQPPPPLLT